MRHHVSQRSALARSIAVALAVTVLGVPVAAFADAAKEQELEARVAELEKMVKQLIAEKQASPTAAAPAAAGAATVAAAPPKPDAKAIQATSITPNAAPGTSFILTGYAKVDGMWSDTSDGELPEANAARDFYVPGATPVGGLDESSADFDAHAKQTRINFGTDTVLDGGDKLMTRFEIDFFGSVTGDQRITNTYAPVLRHAYVQWRHWLVGQTWSNFQDVATLPDSVDFIGSTDGTVFVRQPQVRYTYGGFSFSVENPETTITPFGGGTGGNARITTDDSSIPDLTARYTWKGGWGHFSVAALARELKYQTTGAGAIDDSTWSAAGSLSGKFNIGKNDDIRYMLLGGNLGRYVGLNFTNDAVLDSNGNLDTIDGFAGVVAWRHVWAPKWRTNLYYAMEDYDNKSSLTGGLVNKSSESFTGNVWYTPLPKLDIGAEFRHAVRELENGDDGSLDRLQFTTKYSF
ncbi:MAG TPA: DcaP family trimeric outer membrane transporter [Steroidobacteraceae bacterium]